MSHRVAIRDSRFAGQWHREERREVYRDLDRIFTVCGSPIDEDVLESLALRLGDQTCPVCGAKR